MQQEVLEKGNSRGNKLTSMKNQQLTIEGLPGKFMMIPKVQLFVDHTYQRERKSIKNIQKFFKNWSWYACGALSVVKRNGNGSGKGNDCFYVIDGQHRLEAALLRNDIKDLPCLLFESKSVREEAGKFLELNRERSPINVYDEIKARLIMKDPIILGIKDIIESTGHSISHKPSSRNVKQISCISTLKRTYETNQEIFKKIWALNAAIHKDATIHGHIWEGLFYLERYCITKSRSILEDRFGNRFIRAGREEILAKISDARVLYKKGGAYVYARAMAEIMNHGVPTNYRIEPPQKLPKDA